MAEGQIARGGLYRHSNPPPSRELAITRLEELEAAVENIGVQLENPEPGRHETSLHFEQWRGRTFSVLAHFRAEIKYLKGWLGISVPQQSLPSSHATGLKRIKITVLRMTEEMRQKYKRVYVEGHLPTDVAEAHNRKHELVEVQQKFTALFAELNAQAEEAGVSKHALTKRKRPLTAVFQELIAELKLLNDFIREKSPAKVDRGLFMMSLIDQAIAAGFKVSEEQLATLQEIRDKWRLKERPNTTVEAQ